MNFSEFKKWLGAEPRSQDPEMLQARDSDPEFRAAAREAAAFEDKLETALAVEVPRDLLDRIKAIPEEAGTEANVLSRRGWRWLAAAAAVFAVIGVAGVTWYESTFHWDSVDDYIVDHWAVDGREFLQQADGVPVDRADADKLFASLGMRISPALVEHVDLLHKCKTPDSRGAHMVITTEQGPVTLIFMPKVETVDGHIVPFNNMLAATLELEKGTALVIGPNEEVIASVYAMARNGIRPVTRTG